MISEELYWRERMIRIARVYFHENENWKDAEQKYVFYVEANASIIPKPFNHLSFEFSNSNYLSSGFLVWQTESGMFPSDAVRFNSCLQKFKDRKPIDKGFLFSQIKEKMLRALGTRSRNRDVVADHNMGLCLVCFVYNVYLTKDVSCISLPFIFPFPAVTDDNKAILRKTSWNGDGLQ